MTFRLWFIDFDYEFKPTFNTQFTEGQALAYSVSADKLYMKHQVGFAFSALMEDSAQHHQAMVNYAYFPLGSTKFYLGSEVYLSTPDLATFAIGFKPYVGYRATRKFKWSASYLHAGGHNLLQQNAEIVNNNYHITSSIFETGINYQISPKLNLGLFYQREGKDGETLSDYHYNSLFINLKFTP